MGGCTHLGFFSIGIISNFSGDILDLFTYSTLNILNAQDIIIAKMINIPATHIEKVCFIIIIRFCASGK